MKRLRIDLGELAYAFEHGSWEISYYLDTESGEVLLVGEESRRMLDHIYETYGDQERHVDLDAVLGRRELVEWVKDDLKTAHRIDSGFGSRYLQVPESDSLEGYADMKGFIETVENHAFADKLWSAIQGKGAFRRFKDALAAQPGEEQRWLAFKAEQVRLRIAGWLVSNDIEVEDR
jgi:Uncharacterised protein family (UPF0158)